MDKPDRAQLSTLPSKGVIKRFSNEKRYGFITGKDGVDRFFHIVDAAADFTPKTGAFVLFDPQDHQKGPRAVNVRLDPASLVEVDRTNGKISALQSPQLKKKEEGAISSAFWRVVLCSVVLFWLARENQNEFILGIVVLLWLAFVADLLFKILRAVCQAVINRVCRLLGIERKAKPAKPTVAWEKPEPRKHWSIKGPEAPIEIDDTTTDPWYYLYPGNIYHD
ncbi:cold-shock protein [Methylocaldum szegediense]|uniref:cold-shock protein n=1 Tax=Methylocaldum szegediense TaxID=73780 RepID=UPI000404FB42|nr:cold shock domain-containing protein [Methylocaldum szegediense]